MKYIKLFENFNNTHEDIIKYFFEKRETTKPTNNNVSFEDIYNEYYNKRDSVIVDAECETGLDVYDAILNVLKNHFNKKTITLYRGMFISNNKKDIDIIYNMGGYYKGIGEYWSFDENTSPLDSNDIDNNYDIDNSLQILITASVTPDIINWENTFKHSVSYFSEENEITLNDGVVHVTSCGELDDMGIKVIYKYPINKYVPIF